MRQSQAGSLSFWDLETCGKAGTAENGGEGFVEKHLEFSIDLEILMETGEEKDLLFHNLN